MQKCLWGPQRAASNGLRHARRAALARGSSTADGRLGLVYFLTGRSEASRARDLQVGDDGDVAVVDTSASGAHDALRHYVAAARRGGWTVVGNGDQVAPLAEALAGGTPLLEAAEAHAFEPDEPIFTSRIWVASSATSPADCVFGVARRSGRGDGGSDHLVWSAGSVPVGAGVLMTTYAGDATSVRAAAAPEEVAVVADSLPDLLRLVWSALGPRLRVAALVIDLDDPGAAPLLQHA